MSSTVIFRWTKSVPTGQEIDWEDHPNVVIVNETPGRARIEAYFDARPDAEEFRERFGGRVDLLQEESWVAASSEKTRGRIIRIRDKLVVTLDEDPAFLASLEERFPGRAILKFPPGLAFGTGDHATTATCLRLLCDAGRKLRRDGWSLLDLGTGTGILAVAAKKLGAGRVVASDFDEKAIEVARNRFEHHEISPDEVELKQEDALEWRAGERFNVVTANIYSSILVQIMPKIRASVEAGGSVILSGLLRTQEDEVDEALGKSGLVLQKTVRHGRWVAILANTGNEEAKAGGDEI